MIRQDFSELPPKEFLIQIMDNTMRIYTFLWDKKDEEYKFFINWKELKALYNKNTFLTSLRKICDIGLLNYQESEDGVTVELIGWDDIED